MAVSEIWCSFCSPVNKAVIQTEQTLVVLFSMAAHLHCVLLYIVVGSWLFFFLHKIMFSSFEGAFDAFHSVSGLI